MQYYRLYFLDKDGRIVSADDCEAADDLAALEIGRTRCADHGIEIWQEKRRVGRLKKGDAALEPDARESL